VLRRLRVIKRSVLDAFCRKHRQAKAPLELWYHQTKQGAWQTPDDVKRTFGAGLDFVANNRIIHNISKNRYRLIVEINYRKQAVFIRFLGTHREYDSIDPATVKLY